MMIARSQTGLEDCARRELLQESGQTPTILTFRGFCKIRIENNLEYGAIFQTE